MIKLDDKTVALMSVGDKTIDTAYIVINGVRHLVYARGEAVTITGLQPNTVLYAVNMTTHKATHATADTDGDVNFRLKAGFYTFLATLDGYRDSFDATSVLVPSGGTTEAYQGTQTQGMQTTPLHSYKLAALLDEISQDPTNYVVIGNFSDIHGQYADDIEDNGGDTYHCNLDQIESTVCQLHGFMHSAAQLGASTPATLFTGDFVGRIKPGTGTHDATRNNETGDDVFTNSAKLKTLYDTYAAIKGSSTPLFYGLGNHDARGFETDGHTLEEAKDLLAELNPQFTYPNETNCTGYYYDEADDIVFVYVDHYKYTEGDDEGSAETIKALLTTLNTQYPTSKFLFFGHQPEMKASGDCDCVNSGFYEDLTTDHISISPYSSGFDVTDYIDADKIIAGIYGHQHANAVSISHGYPIVQQPCLGKLNTNDGGQYRHNYYNGTIQLGFVTETAELTNNAPASYTYFIWTYNKSTQEVKCTTLGVGPDTTFKAESNELALYGFTHIFAPEPPASVTDTVNCQYISDPRWDANTDPTTALAYGSTPFIYSSYAYQTECPRKDGVLQTPFGLAGQYYCFAYYKTEGSTKTLKAVSEMYPPLQNSAPFLEQSLNITIQATAGATVTMNGQNTNVLNVPRGTSVSYTVTKDGYSSDSGTIESPSYNVVKKVELEQEINPHYVTLSATHGSILLSPSKPNNKYNEGTQVTVTFSPDAEYKFQSATLTMGGTTQTYTDSFTFSVTADATISATFVEDSTPWIAGNSYTMSNVSVKYAYIQATDNKYNAFDWTTATLTCPSVISGGNWAMFMWVEEPNSIGLKSVTLHGNSDIHYSKRGNFSCYTGKNYASKLEQYSDLKGRGSSMGQTDDVDLVVGTTDRAIGWAYKLSADSDGDYFVPNGTFLQKVASVLNFTF